MSAVGLGGFFAAGVAGFFFAARGLARAAAGFGLALPVATGPSIGVAAAALAASGGSTVEPALAVAPRPDGFAFALALAFGLRAVADFGAAGAPGFGAPTASGAWLGSRSEGGGVVVSSSSRTSRPASSAAFSTRSLAAPRSFFGIRGIRGLSCPALITPMRRAAQAPHHRTRA